MRFLTKKFLPAALVLALANTALVPLVHSDAADGTPHTLNLKDVDITVLIATVSEITGKTFIVDPAVSGKVNVVSSQPLDKAELYQMFLSVLRVHGYTAIETGSAIKIVPEAKAASDGAIDGAVGLGAAQGDEMITRIIQLKHVSPSEMVQILGPLKSPSAQILSHNGSSSLVVADRASNVQRMLEIIRRIDQASQSDIELVALNNANANEVVRTINGLQNAADPTNKVVADERTNSVLLSGERSRRLKLRALIASLDVPLSGSDTMEVVYLRYADATQLVGILEGVLRGSRDSAGAALPGAAGAPTGAALASATVIQAHKETNALIITAPPAVLRELKDLVRKLDIRRAQVLIEAIVVEVTDDQAKQLGIQWQAANGLQNNRGYVGGTNFPAPGPGILNTQNGLTTAEGQAALGASGGLNLGYIVGSFKLGGKELLQLGALANALATDGGGNVLSQPSTIALDHQKATLSVGQEVPFLTGRYQTGNSTGQPSAGSSGINPFQTIDRKEVGLKLEVTPHINEGDSVRMDINIEVSSLAPNVSGASDLITNSRKLSTQAIVRDGGMLVLGGLSSTEARQSESRVPGLGSIPLLGNLFKSKSIDTRKRNLLVFLKPTIARDGMSEDVMTFGKYNQIRDQQIEARDKRSYLMPESGMPVIPDLRDYLDSGKQKIPQGALDALPPTMIPEAMRMETSSTPELPAVVPQEARRALPNVPNDAGATPAPTSAPAPAPGVEPGAVPNSVPNRETYAPASPIRVRPPGG
jgi:general secretion pathway protein D